jgi:hypothetical protein
MGFNKRYVSVETLSHIIENENDLIRYFKNADALIFIDDISREVYNLVVEKKSYKHLIKKIKTNE